MPRKVGRVGWDLAAMKGFEADCDGVVPADNLPPIQNGYSNCSSPATPKGPSRQPMAITDVDEPTLAISDRQPRRIQEFEAPTGDGGVSDDDL